MAGSCPEIDGGRKRANVQQKELNCAAKPRFDRVLIAAGVVFAWFFQKILADSECAQPF
jgi:hypothetical protein